MNESWTIMYMWLVSTHVMVDHVTPFWVTKFPQMLALLGQHAYGLCICFHCLLQSQVGL